MDSVYVECAIRAPIERVWELTQVPEHHERWDLRFSSITYLPRAEGEPQRFRYTTRLGFGLRISGTGETVGEADRPDGTRTSALKFGSDEPLSLIREGSGYWQYEPSGDAVLFRTRYDYRVRHGLFGRLADRLFRPLIGWATAWSFDSLRLWAERGVLPEQARTLALVHGLTRTTLAFVWLWHGLVPKLLFPTTGEVEISVASGIPAAWAPTINTLAGVGECVFALVILLIPRWRWTLLVQVPLLLGLLLPLAVRRPDLFTRPFEPLTLNLTMVALALAGYLAAKDLPSARRCRRRPA